jgi:hypothetical protein
VPREVPVRSVEEPRFLLDGERVDPRSVASRRNRPIFAAGFTATTPSSSSWLLTRRCVSASDFRRFMGVGMGIAARWVPVLERGGLSPIPFFYVMGGSVVFLS